MEHMDTTVNYEIKTKPQAYYLGTLRDLGLGNPDGIPSFLAKVSEQERIEYGEKVLEALAPVTDFTHFACIDGRNCLCNADKSAPEIRRRQVSGTGSLLEISLNAEAPVLQTVNLDDGLDAIIPVIEDDFAKKTGVLPSAHEGGCGGVNGAVQDNQFTYEYPAAITVAAAIMAHPEVQTLTGGLQYDTKLGDKVRANAAVTTAFLEAKGWDGQAYVDAVATKEPAGVEELEFDPNHQFKGHKEASLLLVVSRDGDMTISEQKLKELELGEAFTMNIDASYDMAKAQAGNRGTEGVAQAFIANLAKHCAVADRLPSDETPVYILAC